MSLPSREPDLMPPRWAVLAFAVLMAILIVWGEHSPL